MDMKIDSSYLNITKYEPTQALYAKEEGAQKDVNKEEAKIKPSSEELSSSDKQVITQLQQRDNEVRAHEAAHIAAGGSAVSGGASFTYQEGPDGKLYAIGGEVPISVSPGSSPQDTISVARQIQAAALAPANPSPQDLKVASSAAMMESKARQELVKMSRDDLKQALDAYKSTEDNHKDGKELNTLI